jgi:hypothetical protein
MLPELEWAAVYLSTTWAAAAVIAASSSRAPSHTTVNFGDLALLVDLERRAAGRNGP